MRIAWLGAASGCLFWKEVTLGDFALIDLFVFGFFCLVSQKALGTSDNSLSTPFQPRVCVSFVLLFLCEPQSIAKPTSSTWAGS